jgi:hypothetical protein
VCYCYFSLRMQMRCLLYIFSAAAEDEDVQKKGIVWVVRFTPRCGRILLDDPSSWKLPGLIGVFPVRIHAIHISSDKNSLPAFLSSKLCKMFPALWSAIGRRMRVRSRFYTGTCAVCSMWYWNFDCFQEYGFSDGFSID